MCTLIVATHLWPEAPLVIAANRDEILDRPAAPPRLWSDRDPRIFAPTDLVAGGTWLGLNERGLVTAVTNRFGQPRDPERRSRGELVLLALSETTHSAAAVRIGALEATAYNPFHLVCGDRDGASLIWSDGRQFQRERLGHGIHVVTERSFDAAESGREELIARCVEELDSSSVDLNALKDVLCQHAQDSFDGTCVHMLDYNYGTRSSTVITLGTSAANTRFWHADGPPCRTSYGDLTPQVAELFKESM